ncbi:MAG: hypothetical protein EBZ59_09160 [Planctomycetia bacterium]|nr:hypothetical protein [Planctomycetia bacterium]
MILFVSDLMLCQVLCLWSGRKKKSRSAPRISSSSVAASLHRPSSISRSARSSCRCRRRSVGRKIPSDSSPAGSSAASESTASGSASAAAARMPKPPAAAAATASATATWIVPPTRRKRRRLKRINAMSTPGPLLCLGLPRRA